MTAATTQKAGNAKAGSPQAGKPAGAGELVTGPALTIDNLVLLRIAAAPATRAELQRDLAALVAPKTTGTVFRRSAELAIGAYITQQLISEQRGRLTASAAGVRVAEDSIPPTRITDGGWEAVQTALLTRALGLKTLTPNTAKALGRPEGLAALVLQQHFGLPLDKVLSPTTLRSELAVVALEKAFGNKIKTGLGKIGLGKGSGLPGKAGRVLAGQLFKAPREVASDGKLAVLLAAEVAGAPDTSVDGLTLALIRRLTAGPSAGVSTKQPDPRSRQSAPTPDNDQSPLGTVPVAIERTVVRPNMSEFSSAVVAAARPISEGWPGNRKAFISLVWKAIRNARPEWELSEIAFKSMLAEAHRTGHVVLAGADLKDKCDLGALEDSKILYKNTVWHFVRVED
jgi:hypothetical protein